LTFGKLIITINYCVIIIFSQGRLIVTAKPITFGYVGEIQSETITNTGTYAVTVIGAQGGSGAAGGLGAEVSGNIYLTQGTILEVLVGSSGPRNSAALHKSYRVSKVSL
jgi:hypothetical protein